MNRLDFIITMVSAPFVSMFGSIEAYEKTKILYMIRTWETSLFSKNYSKFQKRHEVSQCGKDYASRCYTMKTLNEAFNTYKQIQNGNYLVDTVIRKYNCVIVCYKDTECDKNDKRIYTDDKSLIMQHIK